MSELTLFGPSPQIQSIFHSLTHRARQTVTAERAAIANAGANALSGDGDGTGTGIALRTLDQTRADLTLQLLHTALHGTPEPDPAPGPMTAPTATADTPGPVIEDITDPGHAASDPDEAAAPDKAAAPVNAGDPVNAADAGEPVNAADAAEPVNTANRASRGGCPCGRGSGVAARVELTMSLSTLLGLDDEPGDLTGVGPIPASMARQLAAHPDSTWRRLLTDPHTGQLLHYGRTTYRPPADLRDFVCARDGICAFPGCHRTARQADLDHIREWVRDHGTTDPHNLSPLCERHHLLKTEYGWRYTMTTDGTDGTTPAWTWTSPTGRTYTSWRPERWPTPHHESPSPSDDPKPGNPRPTDEPLSYTRWTQRPPQRLAQDHATGLIKRPTPPKRRSGSPAGAADSVEPPPF